MQTYLLLSVKVSLLLFVAPAQAQDVMLSLNDVPTGVEQIAGFEDRYVRYRPALAINGFDCTANNATCAHGLGVKQIITGIHTAPEGDRQRELVQQLFELAMEDLEEPLNRSKVARNTQRAQALAWFALVSLVIEQNGYETSSTLHLPVPASHNGIVTRLMATLQHLNAIRIQHELPEERNADDAVKWVGTLGNLSRVVDLYLALERAYIHYDLPRGSLTGCSTKSNVLHFLEEQLKAVDAMGNTPVVELDFLDKVGIPPDVLNIDYDEVQAGNWSMKVHVVSGYAALALQRPLEDSCSTFEPATDKEYAHWLSRALRSAGPNDRPKRKHHWAYQTGGGNRYWAEGPFYFNYALVTVLPFWMALRVHQPDGFAYDAPFSSSWFLDPIRGYADLVAPDGSVPPLEDGNKIPMEAAFLLQWDATFSDDAELGARFKWIAEAQVNLPGEDIWLNMLMVPLASSAIPPRPTVSPEEVNAYTGQIVLRRDGGTGSCDELPHERSHPCHYLLLNGESGNEIEAGEGHEQSDQMQLLYYVDGTSFLIDSGYDNAPGIENSSWNDYAFHNVMTVYPAGKLRGHGGLAGPKVGVRCSLLDPCEVGMFARHASMRTWTHRRQGHIDEIQAAIQLDPNAVPGKRAVETSYERTLYFIDDSEAPYLVDINTVVPVSFDSEIEADQYAMVYHINGTEVHEWIPGSVFEVGSIWETPQTYGSIPAPGNDAMIVQQVSPGQGGSQAFVEQPAREPFIRGIARGDGVPIVRSTYSNRQLDADTGFAVVSILQPRFSSTSSPTYACKSWAQSVARDASMQSGEVYAWMPLSGVLDLIVTNTESEAPEQVLSVDLAGYLGDSYEPAEWVIDNDYSTEGIDVDIQGGFVLLENGVQTGILRLRNTTGGGSCVPTAIEHTPAVSTRMAYSFPNPADGLASVDYTLAEGQEVRLEVFDVLGRRVAELEQGWRPAGEHTAIWNAAAIPAGRYWIRLRVRGQVFSRSITVR